MHFGEYDKRSNIHVNGVQKRVGEVLKEIMTVNFQNLTKDINLQIQLSKPQMRSAQSNPHQDTS